MPLTLAHFVHPASGPETGAPLLIAHGLFGAARNFNTLAKRLAVSRRVVAVDMRNHGSSPWDDAMDYPAMAEDLAEVIAQVCDGRAVVLGHSMGGKAAMTLALTAPGLLAGLIVADIAPVTYQHHHRRYIAAMQAVDLSMIKRRSDADPMLAEAIPEAMLRAFILTNLVVEDGVASWRLNLAALAAGMEGLMDFPGALPQASYDAPALFVHGLASDYVAPEHQGRLTALFPQARIEGIAAGHWLHAEAPEAFLAVVAGWLDVQS